MTSQPNLPDHADQINQFPTLKALHTACPLELIRKPEVLALTCSSKSKHHSDVLDKLMAPSFPIGCRSVAYRKFEILSVIAARIQGKSDDEIRLLVKNLVAQRQNLLSEVQL